MALDTTAENDVRMDMGLLGQALVRRLPRILLVSAICLGGTYALLLFVPKSYESTASILVESRDSAYTRAAGDNGNGAQPVSPDSMISSQIELVKSRDTLLSVVRSENLTQVPEFNGSRKSMFDFVTRYFRKSSPDTAEDVAVDTLADHLMAVRERDSAIINVTVSSTDPSLAARLANAVAQADVARRAGQTISDTADASQWLQQQIVQLRQRVADAESKVANFKVDNDLYTGSNSTSLLDQQMTDISAQITAAQGRRGSAQSRASMIRSLMAAGQPIDGLDDVRNSVTIQQLMQQKAQLTSQRAQLLATLLPTHPSVQAVTAQITSIDRQVGIEGRRVADALEAEAKIEDASITSLQKNLADLKDRAGNATKQGVTLDALDREAKADRDLLESYMTRYRDASARTDPNASLPDLRLITLAAPSPTPASPKTALILGAVAFVSLAVQLGAVVFGELLSGRALVDRETIVRYADRREPEVEPQPELAAASPAGDGLPPAMAEDDVAAEAASAAVAAPASRTSNLGALRSWFRRQAETLTAYEPPEEAAVDESETEPAALPPASPEATDFAYPPASFDKPVAGIVPGHEAAAVDADRLATLSADLVLGRVQIVMLAALDAAADADRLGDRLVADVLHRGLSVARVDAGSGRPSTEPGITDLAAESASFGDVVQKTAEEGLANVAWGHLNVIDRRSAKPLTLVEALSDIYEVVVVMTGRIGLSSTLPMFAGVTCRLVLVSSGRTEPSRVEEARRDAAALGFEAADVIAAPQREAEVA